MPVEYPKETPSQTAGPFVHIGTMPTVAGFRGLEPELGQAIAGPACPGQRIGVSGRVLDATGAPVRDLLFEIWQADPNGIYNHPEDPRVRDISQDFNGFGRVAADFDDGAIRFETVKPGPVPGRDARMQAPHLNVFLLARGINVGLSTRLYFGDEDNAGDPLLALIDPPHRRETLVMAADGTAYSFTIRLQGARETVFLDF
ncbi:protocatechuate 3,4-dioxygenase subunit alpha [Maribius pontilimi]|uniref:Protocatechuate 3,4-dioxygenase subunit alpha n=1 Tax=Palleronia pontilimi TaxID=1964209 RepID=A0A934I9Y0_9RHOB|nr:protocatechuate 3,4-dioxygenase subunit alpha [Palleronia pontilimi]MBJ3763148.1 protocatechuate 3,4-dioxygenase subunit alpha [Palleronia pontilimi]